MKKETIKKIKNQEKKDFSYQINETGDYRESWRIFRIMSEFVEGYQFLASLEREVTIFGSARLDKDSKYCKISEELGYLLAKNNFTVITGGGPGIMEAANKGAFEAKGKSVGLNIQLPFEQRINPYVNKSVAFYYFLTRKVMMTSPANAFVYFPGGFGTMDEFFEVVDLIELQKMHEAPIILVGRDYWQPLIDFIKSHSVAIGSVEKKYVDKWHIVDSAEEAYKFIENTKDITKPACELSPDNFYCNNNLDWKIFKIMAELVAGFDFLTGLIEDVTILGTKSIKKDSEYYKKAEELGKRLAEEKISVVTGGGPGVMEAASKGAFENGGEAIGINMEIGTKQRTNPYLNRSIGFKFHFTRKMILTAPSKAFIFFPGGFGTMHQLFEVLTLIQTGKMQKIPIILFNHKFWEPLHAHIKKIFVHGFETIGDPDDELYQIVDDVESAIKIIKEFRK